VSRGIGQPMRCFSSRGSDGCRRLCDGVQGGCRYDEVGAAGAASGVSVSCKRSSRARVRRASALVQPSKMRAGSARRLSRAVSALRAPACAQAARRASTSRTRSVAHCSRAANGTVWLIPGPAERAGRGHTGAPGAAVVGPGAGGAGFPIPVGLGGLSGEVAP
jgi:hypothetical protein